MSMLPFAVSALSLRSLWSLLDRLPPGRRRRRGGSGRRRASSVTNRVGTYTTGETLRLAGSFSSSLRPGDVLGGSEILRQRAERNRSTAPGFSGGGTAARGESGAPLEPAAFASTHIGRSWTGHRFEDACPCPKAPCGLVDSRAIDPTCPQHALAAAKTMRQMHYAADCPAVSRVASDSEQALARRVAWRR